MNSTKNNIKYIILLLTLSLIWNMGAYAGAKVIAHDFPHRVFSFPLDDAIPFIPISITIYCVTFLFWLINYTIIASDVFKTGDVGEGAKNRLERFFAADFFSRVVCFIFFLVMPTTMVRPVPGTDAVWNTFVTFIYQMDSPVNLFPSIHCLASWLCFIGIRKRDDIPKGYKVFTLIFAILICISTLTTKQHLIPDVIGGIILAEVCYLAAASPKVREVYMKPVRKLAKALKISE